MVSLLRFLETAAKLPAEMTWIFDRESSPTKRKLSLEEKSTLTNFSGKVVILPGAPGSFESPLEFEELLMAGYTEEQMIGFENVACSKKLLEAYYPVSQILGDINKNVQHIERNSVSYIHLDFMRSITQHTFSKAKYYSSILGSDSRFRVTVGSNWGRGAPSGNYHLSCVRNVAYYLFIPMCRRYGVNAFKVSKLEKEVRKFFQQPDQFYNPVGKGEGSGHHGHIGLAMFIFYSFIVRSAENPSDRTVIEKMKFALSNYNTEFLNIFFSDISRFQYKKNEESYQSTMYTIWFDVKNQKTNITILLDQICDLILEPMDMYDNNSN